MFGHGSRLVDYLEFAVQVIAGLLAFAYVALPFIDSPQVPCSLQTPAEFSSQRCPHDFNGRKPLTRNSMHDQSYVITTVRGDANRSQVDSCSR
jgi:hypothetical protein